MRDRDWSWSIRHQNKNIPFEFRIWGRILIGLFSLHFYFLLSTFTDRYRTAILQKVHTSCYPALEQSCKSELINTISSSFQLCKLNIIGLQILGMRRMNRSCCKGRSHSPEDDGSDVGLVSMSVAVIDQSYACKSSLCKGRSMLYLVVASRACGNISVARCAYDLSENNSIGKGEYNFTC
jgi:hypothetical protein